MNTYRFVTTAHQDVVAETLEVAIKAFNGMKQAGLSPKIDTVCRIEVRDEQEGHVPVDRPLRAEYLAASKQAEIRPSA